MDHVRSATAFELQTMEAMDIQEQGELKIWVPEAKQRAQKVAVDASASPDAAAPAAASSAAASEMEAEPLILRIAYTLHARDLTAGMHFLKATPYAPNRASQLVTTSSIACGVEPSLWCPCVDQFDERHTWEMEIAAPIEYVVVASGTLQHKRVIAGGKLLWSFKVDTPVQARAVGLAVGPFVGEVPEEFATARGDPPIKWYSVPARPAGLSKVVESRAAPLAPSIAAAAASSPHAATLSLLRHTLAQHLPAMITLYETLFGSAYPFGAFKVLFLEEVHSSDIGFANFVVLDRDLLYDGTIIDAVYSSTGAIAYAIALNWVSCSLWLESTADWWIVQGIAGWAAGMFVAQVFGTNEMKWRSLQSAAFVMDEDAEQAACYQRDADDGADEGSRRLYDAHPLYWPGFLLFTDLENPVMRAKAQVVFRMLDQRVGGGAAASGQGLKSLVLRIMDEFTAGGSGGGGDDAAPDDANLTARLSTIRLLEICIDLAGQASGVASLKTAGESDNLLMAEHGEPLRAFFEQWILCTGYPALKVDFAYSAKRKVSTVQIEQSPEAAIGAAPGGPLVRFSGALKFRVHEADRINDQERHIPASMTAGPAGATAPGGAAFTQVAPNRIEFEFICSSKVRRNRKRRKMDESSLAALPLDKLLVRHNDTPILYCRVDPLCSWFAPLRTGQPDIHLLWKLLHERELVGQWEGVAAVQAAWRDHAAETRVGEMSAAAAARDATQGVSDEKLPDDIYPKTLWSTFRNEQAFVHIRLFAAKCLAESACASWSHGSQAAAAATSLANLKYVHLLLDWFKKEYYENYESNVHLLSQGMSAEAAEADEKRASTVQLRTNSFGSVQEYMMKQLLPIILSKVRLAGSAPSTGSGTGRTATPGDVTRFVLGLLRDNDNSDNLYSDAFYLGSLLDALGNVRLAQQYDPIEPIQNELVRFLNYDQVVPSYRHHLTQRALMASAKLERTKQFARVIAANETAVAYDHYAGPTHDRAVRLAAFKSLIMVLPTKMHLLRKIIDIIERESQTDLAT